MSHRGTTLALVVLLVVLPTACDRASNAAAGYDLAEFTISGPTSMSADLDQIEVENYGEFAHTMVITDSNGRVAAASGLIQPGETVHLDIDLSAGTYSFTCRIVAQDGEGNLIDHYEAGMNTLVTVEG